jgi:hypothetical protein
MPGQLSNNDWNRSQRVYENLIARYFYERNAADYFKRSYNRKALRNWVRVYRYFLANYSKI